MSVSRRNLRKGLVFVGCLIGHLTSIGAPTGTVLLIVGGLLHWLSKAYLEQNRDLTTAGPYRFTRNPFYLANGLIDAGIVCWIGEPIVAALYLPLWILAYRNTIRGEEERLRELFGERFEAYAARVPRLLPYRRPLDPEIATGRFDWANPSLAEGREYARLLGIALAPAAIWAAEVVRGLRMSLLSSDHALELGGVLLVPALWIVKLALAETLRRPVTRLLPPVGEGVGRILGSIAVSLPLAAGLMASGESAQGIAAIAFVTGALISSTRKLSTALRIAVETVFGFVAIGLGWISGELWLGVVPMLWAALALLDAVGQRRALGRNSLAPFQDWPYLPWIALGSAIAVVVIGSLRIWVRTTI